jgi:hypothetical protein
MSTQPILSPEMYAVERAICDKATAYWNAHATFARNGASSMSRELAAHPDYAACDNAMRGRIEQYEILTNPGEHITAYVSSGGTEVTVWTGVPLGTCEAVTSWPVKSYIGRRMYSYRARIAGREYHGRGFGPGMVINLRRCKG